MLTLRHVLTLSALLALSSPVVAKAAESSFAAGVSSACGRIEAIAAKPTSTKPVSAQPAQAVLVSGNFVAVEHPTSGKAKIVSENGKRYVEFAADFKTDDGPALEVILYRGNQVPLNIGEGSYTSLARLKNVSGTQRYEIPTGLDLAQFGAVAIWCQQFNATFGYAALN